MSCPDWQTLCDRRRAGPGDGPGWEAAVRHLDDCPACQDAAPAADPLLLFRRLPAPAAGASEVEAMKQAVASMRRGETIERRASRRRRSLLRAAALAAVLLGSALLRGAQPPAPAVEPPPPAAAQPQAIASVAANAAEIDLDWLPLVEAVDPRYGSIIQLVDDGIAVVVVVSADPGGEPGVDAEVAYPDA